MPLGEHGVVGLNRPGLHDELVHIPLIMRLPKGEQAGRRITALTQPVDLSPTLLDAFGLPPAVAQGHSLLPLAHGTAAQVRDYACSGLCVGETVEWRCARRNGPSCCHCTRQARAAQLYVKPDDRWELNDMVQHHPALAEHLDSVLRDFVEASRRAGPLQPPELRDVEASQVTEKKAEGQP